MLRNWPGAMRSGHPQTSFAAIGPKADEITAGHALDCRLGENSPLAKLEQLEARILLLGTGFDTCTAFHLAEYRNVAPLESNSFAAIVEGSRQWVSVRDITLNDDDFGFIGKGLERTGTVKKGLVGGAYCGIFPLREAVSFATDWMRANR